MIKYAIQHDSTQEYLRDLGNLHLGQNDAFTNDNSHVEDIITYETKEEAEEVLNAEGLYGCSVVEAPERLLADGE